MPVLRNLTNQQGRRPRRVFYGWYVVAAAFVILFVTGGGYSIIGVMMKPMIEDLGWSRSATSSAVFLNMVVYAGSAVATGRLYDRFGPRWVITASILLFSAGYALMATVQSFWQFLLYYGVLAAVGTGGSTVPMFSAVVGRWFEKRRGLAVSLALAGFSVGQFILIPIYSDLISVSGWRVTSLWIAGSSAVAGVLLAQLVIRGDPWNFGLQPYGLEQEAQETRAPTGISPKGQVEERTAERGPSAVEVESGSVRDLTLGEAMCTRSMWLFTLVMFICGGGDHLVTTHLVPMVTDRGFSAEAGASMLAWLGLLGLVGMLLAGPAADYIGNKPTIAITFALRVVLFSLPLIAVNLATYWVFSLGFGLTLMVTAPLNATVISKLYGVSHLGFICGFVNAVHMVSGGLWGYLGGVVFDQTGSYDLALIISVGLAVVAVVCTLLIRERRHLPRVA